MRADITIDLDRSCSACGKKGAAQNGLCLQCITNRMPGGPMTQLNLAMEYVDLTTEEKAERGRRLADLLRQRRLILDEHRDRKAAIGPRLLVGRALRGLVRLGHMLAVRVT